MKQAQQIVDPDALYQSFDKNLFRLTGSESEDSILQMMQADPSANNSANVTVSASDLGSGVDTSTSIQTTGSMQAGKKVYDNTVPGYILGVDPKDGLAKLYIGTTTAYLNFDGTSLVVNGSLTATAGTIGGFTIAATTLSGGSSLVLSSAGTGTITGGTFQTASSAQRIVLAGADNSMRFYDASSQVIGIGTDAGKAINMALTSGTNNGVFITSSVAGVGFSYTTSDDNAQAVGLDLSVSAGSGSNSLPAIRISYGGTAGFLEATIAGTGKGIFIQRTSGSGTANLLSLTSSNATAGTMLDITRSGSGVVTAINIDHTTSSTSINTGIVMATSSATSTLCYAFRFNGSEISSAAVGGSQNKKIRISIAGTDYYIPCYTS